MASTTEVNIGEQITFFGRLMGTQGISEENNTIVNGYINRLLKSLDPFVKDYEDEAAEMIKQRAEDQERAGKIVLEPTEADINNLKIR